MSVFSAHCGARSRFFRFPCACEPPYWLFSCHCSEKLSAVFRRTFFCLTRSFLSACLSFLYLPMENTTCSFYSVLLSYHKNRKKCHIDRCIFLLRSVFYNIDRKICCRAHGMPVRLQTFFFSGAVVHTFVIASCYTFIHHRKESVL